jgi:hypothetical protein
MFRCTSEIQAGKQRASENIFCNETGVSITACGRFFAQKD